MSDDLSVIARDLKLPEPVVAQAIQLLDEGNTIPFIARFRKDRTGGLDAEQLQAIKKRVAELRGLAERRMFILKSIEQQGALTEELTQEINRTTSNRRLEDLYLPFKSKKQSLTLTAKQQGLEPLAVEILEGLKPDVELASRALEFVRVDRGLSNVDDVMTGVRHILAEKFAERGELRRELRRLLWTQGALACKLVPSQEDAASRGEGPQTKNGNEPSSTSSAGTTESVSAKAGEVVNDSPDNIASATLGSSTLEAAIGHNSVTTTDLADNLAESGNRTEANSTSHDSMADAGQPQISVSQMASESVEVTTASAADELLTSTGDESASGEDDHLAESSDEANEENTESESAEQAPAGMESNAAAEGAALAPSAQGRGNGGSNKEPRAAKPGKKKKVAPHPFKDYENFAEPLKNMPHHRILAINRGERAGQLKAKVKIDNSLLEPIAFASIAETHPFRDVLRDCARDAVNRLILPSLEREIRRELTESAEQHAIRVFAHNLRCLLLQPPVRGKRILAIDPGYKNGCAIAVLDNQGSIRHTDRLFVVGNAARQAENRLKLSQLIRSHQIQVVAIGNGTACREVEQMVSDAIQQDLADMNVQYSIVNEAGASVYSTSELGVEELPNLPPHARSSASIGRRLMDPLSELVKISPGNLGVGLYQHDIKAKHLAESLDEVVEQCVNYVGVNSNTASPALLAYVSGLNQLTARRLFEHRQASPLTNRQQLKQIAGIGDATFVQAAGFLRIYGGDEPLDETSIHPESYAIAERVLERVGWSKQEWHSRRKAAAVVTESAENDGQGAAVPPAGALVSEAPPTGNEGGLEQVTVDSGATEPIASETPLTPIDPNMAVDTHAEMPVSHAVDTTKESKPENVSLTAELRPVAQHAEVVGEHEPDREPRDPFTSLDPAALAAEFNVGELLMRDIIDSLRRPGHDPRQSAKGPVFRSGIIKLENLQPGMKLESQVVNVVDFGLFVDVGLGYSCLVHVSELSRGFVRDLYQLFAVGDRLTTWVKEVDIPRRRVKLTAVEPGTRGAARGHRGGQRGEGQRGEGQRGEGQRGEGQRSESGGRPPREGRGARPPRAGSGEFRNAGQSQGETRTENRESRPARGDGQRFHRGPRPNQDQSRNTSANASNNAGGNTASPRRQDSRPHFGNNRGAGPEQRGGDSNQRSRFRGGDRRPRPRHEGPSRPPAKPKPVKPITDDMLQGKKPMRSFSDLAQFFQKQKDEPDAAGS